MNKEEGGRRGQDRRRRENSIDGKNKEKGGIGGREIRKRRKEEKGGK